MFHLFRSPSAINLRSTSDRIALLMVGLMIGVTAICIVHTGAHHDDDGTCLVCSHIQTPVAISTPPVLPETAFAPATLIPVERPVTAPVRISIQSRGPPTHLL